MKRIILLTVKFLLIVLPVTAQNNWFNFGVKGGINLSNLKNESGGNGDYFTGYHVGAFTNISLGDNFSLQPEVIYSKQGAKYPGGKEHLIDYMNIPLLGMYQFPNGIRVHTGPQVSFKVNSKYALPASSESNHETGVALENDLSSTDASWSFGAGYLSRPGLGIDARYNMGIKDISHSGYRRNQVWQLGLFYQF